LNSGLKKSELADRIRRQIHCWPAASFNESKTTINQMKAALIDPSNGFSISDVVPPVIEGSPLTSMSGLATPPLSRTPPQWQLGSVAAADPLAQPDNHGNDMQREGSKVRLHEYHPPT